MEKTVCVTGAGGFIASWTVLKLLERGYKVHGTVRDPENEKNAHLRNFPGAKERLTLFKADVLDYDSLVPAIRGCDAVFHTACPFLLSFKDAEEVLRPAVTGTENVMKICSEEKIGRVIMTSSMAAVMLDPTRAEDKVVDESCWTDTKYCRENEIWYCLAKTEAEKVAWDLAKEYNLDLVVICPPWTFGPLLQPTLNGSTLFLKSLVDGSSESYAYSHIPVADVRDVAVAHILAFENPSASGRYCCVERVTYIKDVIKCLKTRFPELSYSEKCLNDDTFKIPSPGNISNRKIQELINSFIPHEDTLYDTIKSLQNKHFL